MTAPPADMPPLWSAGFFLLHPSMGTFNDMLSKLDRISASNEAFYELGWLNHYFHPSAVTWLPYWVQLVKLNMRTPQRRRLFTVDLHFAWYAAGCQRDFANRACFILVLTSVQSVAK